MTDTGGFFLLGSPFSVQSLTNRSCVHPLQVFAPCLMMTRRASNEKALLVHTGTTVHVIPWETGHRLLATRERTRRKVLRLKTCWVLNPFLAMRQISRTATEAGHRARAARAQPPSCSAERHVSLHGTSTSTSHRLHVRDQPKLKTQPEQS